MKGSNQKTAEKGRIAMYIKGVNLGNWLVLEKWMSPALFDGTTAEHLWRVQMEPDAGGSGVCAECAGEAGGALRAEKGTVRYYANQ